MKTLINLTGQAFNRLTVVASAPPLYGRTAWLCECECGKSLVVTANALRRGNTKSCGCLRVDRAGASRRTHGRSKSLEYQTWCAMKSRCENPNNQDFHHYGGRGIKICQEWSGSFETFLADMGLRPERNSTLERIDTNGDYCPSNCKWAPQAEQTRNKRTNRLYTINGETLCLVDWANRVGIDYRTIDGRMARGWPPEVAIMTPLLSRWNTSHGTINSPSAA